MSINEWIWFDNKNQWLNETKQEDLNYYTDMYEAGQTKQKLKIWREVEWSVGQFYIWNFIITTTWVKTVSWVWFKPKLIKLTSFISWTNQWSSQWYYYNNQVYCMYTYVIGGNSVYWWASYSSYCYSGYSWWNVSITTSIVPTTDGFTINVLNVSWWPISIIYECYQ